MVRADNQVTVVRADNQVMVVRVDSQAGMAVGEAADNLVVTVVRAASQEVTAVGAVTVKGHPSRCRVVDIASSLLQHTDSLEATHNKADKATHPEVAHHRVAITSNPVGIRVAHRMGSREDVLLEAMGLHLEEEVTLSIEKALDDWVTCLNTIVLSVVTCRRHLKASERLL